MLLGTAGTGKTHTAKLAIQKARRTFESFESVLTVAFSGVAAANLGDGARTVDSVFHTNTDNASEDLSGEGLDKAVDMLRHVQLLVIDEVSTLGAPAFEIVCRRLEQVGKVVWRHRFEQPPPESLGGFGGIGVLLIGDFAQLPPVLSSSLLAESPLLEGRPTGRRSLALSGRKTFQSFTKVLRLRRVHRLLGVDQYKESTLRLRDGAISVEDYDLWKTHELDTLDPDRSSLLWPGAEGLLDEALVLVTDNAQAGRINGKRLTSGVPLLSEKSAKAPGNASSMGSAVLTNAHAEQIVVRCSARHNKDKARHLDAKDFRNLRTTTHLRVGARVILTTNRLWSVDTVPLGLMNGARGIIVAILFAEPGSIRRDELDLAGVGFPQSDGACLPRRLDHCPLPDVVVVHFPNYKGANLLPGLPATWVPVPCIQQQSTRNKSLFRVGLPLKLAWALTIHKAQGLTEANGVIVSFEDSRMIRAVSRMGLAFVAWTRATAWQRMAFVALPPIEDFLAVRFSKEFHAREAFEAWADGCHDQLLADRGIDESEHILEHQIHLQAFVQQNQSREATQEELADVESMLRSRGVAPVSDSVLRIGSGQGARATSGGLWSIVASFRADKKAVPGRGADKTKKAGRGKRHDAGITSKATAVVMSILKEHGYKEEHMTQALALHGPDLSKCVEFCISPENPECSVVSSAVTDNDWADQVIRGLGFDKKATTIALENSGSSFPCALRALLLGNDFDGANQVGTKQFRRHTTKKVYSINPETLFSDPVRAQYEKRSKHDLQLSVKVVDLGQYAGDTTAACFWLSLAAGLAHAHWEAPLQTLPALADVSALLAEVRGTDLTDLDYTTTSVRLRDSPVAQVAVLLRQYMCHGRAAVMLQSPALKMLFPAFAALDGAADSRTMQQFKNWVTKLAFKEYADQLVLWATAHALQVEITCVPFTPESSNAPWVITKYRPSEEASYPSVLIGNNDVHYVYLATTATSTPGLVVIDSE